MRKDDLPKNVPTNNYDLTPLVDMSPEAYAQEQLDTHGLIVRDCDKYGECGRELVVTKDFKKGAIIALFKGKIVGKPNETNDRFMF